METLVTCSDLFAAIDDLVDRQGFRLDMIAPADAPKEALMSRSGEVVRLVTGVGDLNTSRSPVDASQAGINRWIAGRAGMRYLDLIPDRFGGNIIASRIRLTKGGPVADHVHYHNVRFQMIFCITGRIRVVYEGQGPPFWLEPGDCVLQPPQIRHRVLEADAGAEVLEIACPAAHETWIDHDLELPSNHIDPRRDFGGQRFVRHIASVAEWTDATESLLSRRDIGIGEATDGLAAVSVLKMRDGAYGPIGLPPGDIGFEFLYILSGELDLIEEGKMAKRFGAGAGCVVSGGPGTTRNLHPGIEAVCVQIPGLLS